MKIKVRFEVSQTHTYETYDLEDLGITLEEWNEMSDDAKNILLMDMVTDQPYYQVDRIKELS